MSSQIKNIISAIDQHLTARKQSSIDANSANALLDKLGLLKDSKDRPGKPLRELLRKGLIPHAYQTEGKGSTWVIPRSKSKPQNQNIKNESPLIAATKMVAKTLRRPTSTANTSFIGLEKKLLYPLRCLKASDIDNIVPTVPGIYIVRINHYSALPKEFRTHQQERGHNILYIGITTTSLRSRFLNQEIRAKGHGTFFRSVGAMLGYTPPKGSLVLSANKRNFKFSSESEKEIIRWINNNLLVHWVECNEVLEFVESELVGKHKPLLNIAKNPSSVSELKLLRKRCVDIANS
jgi:hypothetical protein